jgi:antirepressor|nr:MAG TPA: hypothetical protein [Caudoviricetes sp.]
MSNLLTDGNNPFEIFNYKNLGTVRTRLDEHGNPWFCLSDVCSILGLSTVAKVKERLSDPYVNSIHTWVQTGFNADGTPAMRQTEMTFINESNLYRVVLGSRKAEAKLFSDWICNEVIPSIRRTGQYHLDNPSVYQVIRLMNDAMENLERKVDEHFAITQDNSQILVEHSGRITAVEEAQKAVFETEYWSILGFANYYRLDPNSYNSSELGKKASKYCRENNIAIGYRPDQHYGRVNIYPYNVLVEVFNNTFSGN